MRIFYVRIYLNKYDTAGIGIRMPLDNYRRVIKLTITTNEAV